MIIKFIFLPIHQINTSAQGTLQSELIQNVKRHQFIYWLQVQGSKNSYNGTHTHKISITTPTQSRTHTSIIKQQNSYSNSWLSTYIQVFAHMHTTVQLRPKSSKTGISTVLGRKTKKDVLWKSQLWCLVRTLIRCPKLKTSHLYTKYRPLAAGFRIW